MAQAVQPEQAARPKQVAQPEQAARPEQAVGGEFLGEWESAGGSKLSITPTGKFFVVDTQFLGAPVKLNASYEDGALKVSAPTGPVLATYDKQKDAVIFLEEFNRVDQKRLHCCENLRALNKAKDFWALEFRCSNGTSVTMEDLISPGGAPIGMGYINASPRCPAGGVYTLNAIGNVPVCSLASSGHVLTD